MGWERVVFLYNEGWILFLVVSCFFNGRRRRRLEGFFFRVFGRKAFFVRVGIDVSVFLGSFVGFVVEATFF